MHFIRTYSLVCLFLDVLCVDWCCRSVSTHFSYSITWECWTPSHRHSLSVSQSHCVAAERAATQTIFCFLFYKMRLINYSICMMLLLLLLIQYIYILYIYIYIYIRLQRPHIKMGRSWIIIYIRLQICWHIWISVTGSCKDFKYFWTFPDITTSLLYALFLGYFTHHKLPFYI